MIEYVEGGLVLSYILFELILFMTTCIKYYKEGNKKVEKMKE